MEIEKLIAPSEVRAVISDNISFVEVQSKIPGTVTSIPEKKCIALVVIPNTGMNEYDRCNKLKYTKYYCAFHDTKYKLVNSAYKNACPTNESTETEAIPERIKNSRNYFEAKERYDKLYKCWTYRITHAFLFLNDAIEELAQDQSHAFYNDSLRYKLDELEEFMSQLPKEKKVYSEETHKKKQTLVLGNTAIATNALTKGLYGSDNPSEIEDPSKKKKKNKKKKKGSKGGAPTKEIEKENIDELLAKMKIMDDKEKENYIEKIIVSNSNEENPEKTAFFQEVNKLIYEYPIPIAAMLDNVSDLVVTAIEMIVSMRVQSMSFSGVNNLWKKALPFKGGLKGFSGVQNTGLWSLCNRFHKFGHIVRDIKKILPFPVFLIGNIHRVILKTFGFDIANAHQLVTEEDLTIDDELDIIDYNAVEKLYEDGKVDNINFNDSYFGELLKIVEHKLFKICFDIVSYMGGDYENGTEDSYVSKVLKTEMSFSPSFVILVISYSTFNIVRVAMFKLALMTKLMALYYVGIQFLGAAVRIFIKYHKGRSVIPPMEKILNELKSQTGDIYTAIRIIFVIKDLQSWSNDFMGIFPRPETVIEMAVIQPHPETLEKGRLNLSPNLIKIASPDVVNKIEGKDGLLVKFYKLFQLLSPDNTKKYGLLQNEMIEIFTLLFNWKENFNLLNLPDTALADMNITREQVSMAQPLLDFLLDFDRVKISS